VDEGWEAPLAFFLVRAWYEDGRLYARVRHSQDVSQPETELLTTDPDDLVKYLVTWLRELSPATPPPHHPPSPLEAEGA
jgi:hypothetical protein